MTVAVEPVLAVEGLTKLYQRRPARWHRILLPWSRIDMRGTVEDDEDDDDVDDEVVDDEHDLRNATVALRDVSFELGPGLNVALVGLEGAGRRTLQRVLGGFSVPTSGRAQVRGTVGPSPRMARTIMAGERSTDKNILGLARFMGRSARLAKRRGDEILEFAGLEQHERRLGQLPSQTVTRFLFSAVLHLEPDLLLAEAWYADKDAEFRTKALERVLRERDRRGMSILHRGPYPGTLEEHFDRMLWLDRGRLVAYGDVGELLPRYSEWRERRAEEEGTDVAGPLHVARVVDGAGNETGTVDRGDAVRIELEVDASALRTAVECTLEIDGERTGRRWPLEEAGSFVLSCTLPVGTLAAGRHVATLRTTTDEVHGQRRTAEQELVVVVEGDGAGAGRPLSEVAEWSLDAA